MSQFFKCLLGPRLYRMYKTREFQGREYEGNVLESYSDSILRTAMLSISLAWSLGIYACPLIAAWIYRRGHFNPESFQVLYKLTGTFGFVLLCAVFVRGMGRLMNNDYITFLKILEEYKERKTPSLKGELSQYDFEFYDWPVDFVWNENKADSSRPRLYIEKSSTRRGDILERMKNLPCDILSYVAIHTFGRRMIYPGSVQLLHALLSPVLIKGRTKLIEDNDGERNKLLTREGNEIDSVFIDRRDKPDFPDGNVLVVCCEGNSGFYEYGITVTPIDAGFSVLGWNHPGFACSTGIPFPEQETNAIDTVMQFAIHRLGFKPENILIYAWSIGGFSATWAAMNYPDIKGLVLDATFDDLVPLAVTKMFQSWRPIIVRIIRDYMDLNIAAQLLKYSGPVLLVRRTKDEIISTVPSRSIQTNRGNELLTKFLQGRFPKLVTDETIWALNAWLSGDRAHQNVLWNQQEVENDLCQATLTSYIEENSVEFPMNIGEGMENDMKVQLILYLAKKHMMDYDSTHCVPLPSRKFHYPWDIKKLCNSSNNLQNEASP